MRPGRRWWVALALAGAGCAEMDLASGERGAVLATPNDQAESQVRIDVFPGQPVAADGTVRALPQSIGPFTSSNDEIRLEAISLARPGSISGLVVGEAVTPWADGAVVPSVDDPVAASVRIHLDQTVQSYLASTDETGFYEALVVPSAIPYQVTVIPEDPRIPFGTRDVVFREQDEVADFELGSGVALYGRIQTGDGEALAGMQVVAIDPVTGAQSAPAITDAAGWYEIRVQPGNAYDVRCLGRDHGRDPILDQAGVVAAETAGARVDFAYPTLDTTLTSGRVLSTDGAAVTGTTVRFIATRLTGYDGLLASLVVEDTADANGNFATALVAGEYIVEFLPPPEDDPELDHGPLRFAADTAAPNLGPVVLPDLVHTAGQVIDGAGNPVGGGRVACTEVGFGARTWTTFARRDGTWELDLPPVAVDCRVQPAGDATERYAWTTTRINPSATASHDLDLREGTLVSGVVRLEGVPEEFALVEIRDGLGTLLGSGLTSADPDLGPGAFAIRVDLPAEDESAASSR